MAIFPSKVVPVSPSPWRHSLHTAVLGQPNKLLEPLSCPTFPYLSAVCNDYFHCHLFSGLQRYYIHNCFIAQFTRAEDHKNQPKVSVAYWGKTSIVSNHKLNTIGCPVKVLFHSVGSTGLKSHCIKCRIQEGLCARFVTEKPLVKLFREGFIPLSFQHYHTSSH